jgi:pantetheine-phosphate adenylyltransferase
MNVAVFPGSFDPITVGHIDILNRILGLFDKIIIAIGVNVQKNYAFPLEKRKQWIIQSMHQNPKIEVLEYEGLTIDFCHSVGANYIIRGVRSIADFEYEKTIAHVNKSIDQNIETISLFTSSEHAFVSSSIVRELMTHQGDVSHYVPVEIFEELKEMKIG